MKFTFHKHSWTGMSGTKQTGKGRTHLIPLTGNCLNGA